jgi:hypothetical protein
MATECYRIEWTGRYSLSEASSRPEARKLGLYMVFASSTSTNPLYIGKATRLGTRINRHRQDWRSSPSELNTVRIAMGVLTSLDGKPATQKQLSDVEKFLIWHDRPKRNAESTKQRYTGRSIIVVSVGRKGRLVLASDKQLVKLIRTSRVA